MSALWLATVLFAAPPDATAEHTAADWRAEYRQAMRMSAKQSDAPPEEVAPKLVALYAELERPNALSSTERLQSRRILRNRLESVRDELRRKQLRVKKAAAQHGNGSPAELAQAQQLIDLIQTTVAPASWQANGGRGGISYFSNGRALVVRQTGEVHEQLGGTLSALRR